MKESTFEIFITSMVCDAKNISDFETILESIIDHNLS